MAHSIVENLEAAASEYESRVDDLAAAATIAEQVTAAQGARVVGDAMADAAERMKAAANKYGDADALLWKRSDRNGQLTLRVAANAGDAWLRVFVADGLPEARLDFEEFDEIAAAWAAARPDLARRIAVMAATLAARTDNAAAADAAADNETPAHGQPENETPN